MIKTVVAICIIISLFYFSCTGVSDKKVEFHKYPLDSVYQKYIVSLHESTVADKAEDKDDSLQAILQNFKRINSLTKWDSIVSKGLDMSLEGGYVDFYYANSRLEKALVRYYGESWQQIKEYYFLDKKPSFVFAKYYHYNAPVYLDSTMAAKEGSDLFFDGDSAKIDLTRTYLLDGEIIKMVSAIEGVPLFKESSKKEAQKKT